MCTICRDPSTIRCAPALAQAPSRPRRRCACTHVDCDMVEQRCLFFRAHPAICFAGVCDPERAVAAEATTHGSTSVPHAHVGVPDPSRRRRHVVRVVRGSRPFGEGGAPVLVDNGPEKPVRSTEGFEMCTGQDDQRWKLDRECAVAVMRFR